MHGLDVLFQHAMELEGLPVGEPDAAVERLFGGELVDAQPLLWLDDATRKAATQHDVLQRLQFLSHALGTDVAIILFVHAVEADQLEIVAVESAGESVTQILTDGSLQIMAVAFQAFIVGQGRIGQLGAFVQYGVRHGISLESRVVQSWCAGIECLGVSRQKRVSFQ